MKQNSTKMDRSKLEELLSCPVCLEKLNETNKVLPCQHTFCTRCLEKLMTLKNGKLHCPECRTLYNGNIKDLPCNIFVNRVVEELKLCTIKTKYIEGSQKDELWYNPISSTNGKFSSILNRLRERIKNIPISSTSYSLLEQRITTGSQYGLANGNRLQNYAENNLNDVNQMNYLNRNRPILKAVRRCQSDGSLSLSEVPFGVNNYSIINSQNEDFPSFEALRSIYENLERIRSERREMQLLPINLNLKHGDS